MQGADAECLYLCLHVDWKRSSTKMRCINIYGSCLSRSCFFLNRGVVCPCPSLDGANVIVIVIATGTRRAKSQSCDDDADGEKSDDWNVTSADDAAVLCCVARPRHCHYRCSTRGCVGGAVCLGSCLVLCPRLFVAPCALSASSLCLCRLHAVDRPPCPPASPLCCCSARCFAPPPSLPSPLPAR